MKTQIEILCSTQKGAKKTGLVFKRDPKLSYDNALDMELADWIYCSIDLGYVLTRENIKEKTVQLITPTNPTFKGSDG